MIFNGCLYLLGVIFVVYLLLSVVHAMLGIPGVIAYMLLAFLLMALK